MTNTALVKIVDDLTVLAVKYKLDKWGSHWYTQHYTKHFEKYRNSKINLLEIGVGGYNDPTAGGDSLRMWAEYFPLANVYGLDICPKALSPMERVSIFQGNQSDPNCLMSIFNTVGGLDIVIDDGSHQNDDVIKSFKFLFTLLNHDGTYVVEDTQTAYWPCEGRPKPDPNSIETSMGYFKSLTDCLNYEEFLDEGYRPTFMDRHIVGVHFYHNLVFIEKGANNEGSSILLNNRLRGTMTFSSYFIRNLLKGFKMDVGPYLYATLHPNDPGSLDKEWPVAQRVPVPGYRRGKIPTPPSLLAAEGDYVVEEVSHLVSFKDIGVSLLNPFVGIIDSEDHLLFYIAVNQKVDIGNSLEVKVHFPCRLG